MITGLREDFKPGQPVSAVPASWYNRVAHFLTNLCGGQGIRVSRDTDPPTIALDIAKAKAALNVAERCPNNTTAKDPNLDTPAKVSARAPEAVEQVATDANGAAATESDADKIARIGTSKFAARADHTHRDPVIHQTRQTLDDMFEVDGPDANLVNTLKFYPPVFDPGGRFIGLSETSVEICKFYAVVD